MAAKKKSLGRYGKKASSKVGKAMGERKRGSLRSGGSGKKVKSQKQAIAIGLSEARRAGGKVPPKKKTKSASKTTKSASKTSGPKRKTASKKRGATKKSASKTSGSKKRSKD